MVNPHVTKGVFFKLKNQGIVLSGAVGGLKQSLLPSFNVEKYVKSDIQALH